MINHKLYKLLAEKPELFKLAFSTMSQDLNTDLIFNPKDPISGFLFLRDTYCMNKTEAYDSIYRAVQPLHDVAKHAGYTKAEIEQLPHTNYIKRYDIQRYIDLKYIDGSIEYGFKHNKANQIISSSINLNHIIFINLFVYKSELFKNLLPKKSFASKAGYDRLTSKVVIVMDFLNTFFSDLSENEKQQIFKSLT